MDIVDEGGGGDPDNEDVRELIGDKEAARGRGILVDVEFRMVLMA